MVFLARRFHREQRSQIYVLQALPSLSIGLFLCSDNSFAESNNKMKVAFFSTQDFEPSYFLKSANNLDSHFFKESLNPDTISLTKGFDAICLFVNDVLDAACFAKLAEFKVRGVAMRCSGLNNIDLAAASKEKIPVRNVPHYSPYAVAEHAMALILCLNRKIHKAYNRVREGNFSINGLQGFDLHGKTVGIIGLGAIGQVFAQICLGFGCRVLVHDPYVAPPTTLASLDLLSLCQAADVISLHCPLTEETHHLLGAHEIAQMKPGVILINTGRGALIDTKVLIKHLKQGRIGGLGLDVYEQESQLFFSDHSCDIIQDDLLMRLTTFPNVVITSHQAYLTKESLLEIARVTIDNLNRF